jgi:hypothetical protein
MIMKYSRCIAVRLIITQVLIPEEVKRVIAKDDTGRTVTTIRYDNEPAGVIKKVMYGDGQKIWIEW